MAITRYDCITCKVRNCSILNTCDTQTLTAISTYKLSKSLQKGERLFSEGDPVLGVYFIKKGFIKVELNGKMGRPLILQIAGKGAVFGHRANTSHFSHTCSATAVSEVQYCYIPYDLFGETTDKSPVLRQQIINQFLNELELVEKKAVNLAHKTGKNSGSDFAPCGSLSIRRKKAKLPHQLLQAGYSRPGRHYQRTGLENIKRL